MKGKLATATPRSIALNWIEGKGPRPPKTLVIHDLHIFFYYACGLKQGLLVTTLQVLFTKEKRKGECLHSRPIGITVGGAYFNAIYLLVLSFEFDTTQSKIHNPFP